MKKIRFDPSVAEEVRGIEQRTAINILRAIHGYAEAGTGSIKRLSGQFEGLLRLRVGEYRVLFDEAEDVITIHRVRHRKDVYR